MRSHGPRAACCSLHNGCLHTAQLMEAPSLVQPKRGPCSTPWLCASFLGQWHWLHSLAVPAPPLPQCVEAVEALRTRLFAVIRRLFSRAMWAGPACAAAAAARRAAENPAAVRAHAAAPAAVRSPAASAVVAAPQVRRSVVLALANRPAIHAAMCMAELAPRLAASKELEPRISLYLGHIRVLFLQCTCCNHASSRNCRAFSAITTAGSTSAQAKFLRY